MAQNGPTSTVIASAEFTATHNSSTRNNSTGRGGHIIIDVTATTATPSVTFTIQGYDSVSDSWYDILTSAAITATGTTRLTVYPGVASTANVSVPDVLPYQWRVRAVHADADAITYSVTSNLVI